MGGQAGGFAACRGRRSEELQSKCLPKPSAEDIENELDSFITLAVEKAQADDQVPAGAGRHCKHSLNEPRETF